MHGHGWKHRVGRGDWISVRGSRRGGPGTVRGQAFGYFLKTLNYSIVHIWRAVEDKRAFTFCAL